ncbi:MAG: DUF364 domain-containing protein [Bacteroidales bacterium]
MKGKNDILINLFEKVQQTLNIEKTKFTWGAKYVAAMNEYGQIGVCATLGINIDGVDLHKPDFGSIKHRIAINALVNSYLNYSEEFDGRGDIFATINFGKYQNIVMIGYFGSLARKFEGKGITLNIFDLDQLEMPVLPMNKQVECLQKCDCVIATSTSISNGTLTGIIGNAPNSADIFLLGPSTPMDALMFAYPNIKGLFGSVFKPFDENPLSIIAQGEGTRQFMQYMEKVYRVRKEGN